MWNNWLTIGKITIHGYGVMIGIGFAVAVLLSMYRAKKKNMNQDVILDLAIGATVIGFLGAKLLFVIVEWKTFLTDPWYILGSGGFVLYGGIIAGVLAGVGICKWKKLDTISYFDLVMPQIAIAQGFGRIGCLFAGCCYGAVTHSKLGITFPEGSLAPSGITLWPTQIFSSIGDFVIAGILLIVGSKIRTKGNIGALYMILYGVGRFGIEFLRNDYRGSVGILSTSQFISIFIVTIGVGLTIWNIHKSKKTK